MVLCLITSCKKDSDTVNPSTSDLNEGLIAYYPFNGNSDDESGNAYNLTAHETVLISNRFGEASKAYSFNGTTSYMTIPPLLKADSLRDFTISLWVKTEASKSQHLFSFFANPDAQYCDHFCELIQTNGTFLIYHEIVTSYYAYGCSMADIYDTIINPVGKWTHIVLLQHYDTEKASYKEYSYSHYVNGKKLKSASGTETSEPNPKAIKLDLGGIIGSSGNLNFFNGGIDDIRIYNRALSEDEILQLYNLQY